MTTITYVDATWQPPFNFTILPALDPAFPSEVFNQAVVYRGRNYTLLNIYQETLTVCNRVSLLFIKIVSLFLCFYSWSAMKQNVAAMVSVFSGKKNHAVYQEDVSNPLEEESEGQKFAEEKADDVSSFASLHTGLTSKNYVTQEKWDLSVEFKQVEVLDQHAIPSGSLCGIHALKNAMAAFGVAEGIFSPDIFKSISFYELFEILVNKQRRKESGEDVSIIALRDVWQFLLSDRPFPEGLLTAQKDLAASVRQLAKKYEHAFCLFTYSSDNLRGKFNPSQAITNFAKGKVGVGGFLPGQSESPFITNFASFQNIWLDHPSEPIFHLFMMGSNDHWGTVVVERNTEGKVIFCGFDSLYNLVERTKDHTQAITEALINRDFATTAFLNNEDSF